MPNGLITTQQFPGLVPDVQRGIGGVSQGLGLVQQAQQLQTQRQQQLATREQERLRSVIQGAAQVQAIPTTEGKIRALESRLTGLRERGIPTDDTQEALDLFAGGRIGEGNQLIDQTVQVGERLGFIKPLAGAKVSAPKVQSSRQLPGGLVQNVMTDGTVELVEPEEAEAELVRQAEERGAELQGLRAGERTGAAEAIKQSIGAFKQITPLRKNIANLDEGIRLLDEGAETGFVAARLPSVKAASIKLDNLQARLGLDVIGNTTFGALSESELAFALSAALPQKLEGPDLRRWMQEKKESQSKLLDYLTEAAIFLGTPGNTVADFLQQKRDEEAIRQPTAQAQPITQMPATQDPAAQQPQAGQVGRFTVEVLP